MSIIVLFLAVIIGISLGLIGGGGSILTVPVLVYVAGVSPTLATAYSLFIVGSTSLVGAFTNLSKKLVHLPTAIIFSIPSFIAVYAVRKFVVPAIPKVLFSIGSLANHHDMVAPHAYVAGKPVSIRCVFTSGKAMIYANDKLLKTETGITQNTKDDTAAGRLGTVDQNFETVGDVVLESDKKGAEYSKIQNFKGILQFVKIYNEVLKK